MNTLVQIQDSGNLILRDNATRAIIWESFSHPTDVFLPNMKVFDNINTGEKTIGTSWKNISDPGVGNFMMGLEALNIPQAFTWNNGRPYWRSGPWNGQIFIGTQNMYGPYLDICRVVNDHAGIFYIIAPYHGRFLGKFSLNSSGSLIQTLWNDQKKDWDIVWLSPQNECDIYGTGGPFGSCNAQESPICSCLRGFEPVNEEEWERGNWTSGCRRRKQLQCDQGNNTGGDGFLRLQFMKVPDFAEQLPSRREDECRSKCLRNCSCIAYAHDPNIGCMFWSGSLIDVQRFAGVGYDLHIRLSTSELDNHKDKKLLIITLVVTAIFCLSILILISWCWILKQKGEIAKDERTYEVGHTFSAYSTTIVLKDELQKVNIDELPLFTFETLVNATDQFHDNNLLGKGGFGPVYKRIHGP